MIASPHGEASHFYLVAEGCPSRATTIATLAAHVAGFDVFKLRCASATDSSPRDQLQHFKADLVRLYLRAGVKVCLFLYDKILLSVLVKFKWLKRVVVWHWAIYDCL
jgi:hypothetical protein